MVLIQNYNEVKQYKKTIILILCLIISLSLISCTKSVETINTTSESSYSSNDNAKKESTTKPSSNSNEQNEKSITSLYVSYGGIKIDITSDQDEIDEIVAAEKSSKIPETKLVTIFANVFETYDDNSHSLFGTIYIGEDNCYYLKFKNSDIEGAAFKLPDESISNSSS